jgi:uncharacterized paraquat-inducible protein A
MAPTNPSPQATDARKNFRMLFCSRYDACLDTAIAENWQGFSCSQCQAYDAANWDWEDWLEDAAACAALLSVVFSVRPAHLELIASDMFKSIGSVAAEAKAEPA